MEGNGDGLRRDRRRPPSTVSSVASERTPLAHAGALTERDAARGWGQDGALLSRLGKAEYHLFTPNAEQGEGLVRLVRWSGVDWRGGDGFPFSFLWRFKENLERFIMSLSSDLGGARGVRVGRSGECLCEWAGVGVLLSLVGPIACLLQWVSSSVSSLFTLRYNSMLRAKRPRRVGPGRKSPVF